LEDEIMNQFWKLGPAAVAAACALLGAANAQAAAINNPCPSTGSTVCQFRFDENSDIPFLNFSSGEYATDLSSLTRSYFGAYVDGSGNMTWHDTEMQQVPTSVGLSGGTVRIRLIFSSVTGTTVLTATSSTITWAMKATATFDNGGTITEANCATSEFEIDFSGVSWDDGVSDAFTIPTVTGCGGHSTLVNADFGLGVSGATLTLYKFEGFNGSSALTGS
jgi:hypothetical protein